MNLSRNKTFKAALFQTVLAMLCFMACQRLFGMLYEILLINNFRYLSSESMKLLYAGGSLLITMATAFPLFSLIMKSGLRSNISFFRITQQEIGIIEQGKYMLLTLASVSLVVLIEVILIYYNKLDVQSLVLSSGTDILISVMQSVVILPVLEEIMFRGIVLKHFKKYGGWSAITVSTLFFAVGRLNPFHILIAVPMGYILGYVALRSGSIRDTTVIHIVANLFGNILVPVLLLHLEGGGLLISAGISVLFILSGGLLFLLKKRKLFAMRSISRVMPRY